MFTTETGRGAFIAGATVSELYRCMLDDNATADEFCAALAGFYAAERQSRALPVCTNPSEDCGGCINGEPCGGCPCCPE